MFGNNKNNLENINKRMKLWDEIIKNINEKINDNNIINMKTFSLSNFNIQ